jgi:uncharacterized membrane protein YvbJ
LDPQKTKDGKPYGPARYKEIVKDCWYISNNIHTSYNDVLKVSPSERELLIKYISDENKRKNDQLMESVNNSKKSL